MNYLEALSMAEIRPDLLLVQSWYEEPSIYLPENQAYTMANIVLEASPKVESLFRVE